MVWEVYRRLAAQGTRVLVVTALDRERTPFSGVAGLETHVSPIWDMSGVLGAQVGFAPSLFRSTAKVLDDFQPTVVHANGLHFQSTLAAAWANRSRKRPMVFTSHVANLDSLQQPTRALTAAYERSVGRFVLSRCQGFIAISPSVRTHLEHLGIAPELIHDVPNGVDHSQFFPDSHKPQSQAPPLVMFVGRHIANKGPHILLQALAVLRNRDVCFRAEYLSSGPLRRRLEQQRDALGLQDQVVFRGHVADVAAEMRRADVIVRPSFSEGMPLSLLEAMASGACLVVSDIAGNRDLIRHDDNGLLVAAARPDLLADELERVLLSPGLRERLSTAAFSASRRYSWDKCAAETLAVLQQTAFQSNAVA